jgi:hypothetical protein
LELEDYFMIFGKLTPQGDVLHDGWDFVYETTFTVTTTSLTISSLDGNTHEEYLIRSTIKNGYNGAADYYIQFNTDSGANYTYQFVYGSDGTVGAARATTTGFTIGTAAALADVNFSNVLILAKSGFVRTALVDLSQQVSGTTVSYMTVSGRSWTNTTDNITAIKILATQNGGLGIGSHIVLYKKARRV